ncbi:MAG: UDP-glucose 4-epimerase-like protein [Acidimicrobiales bacterium]|nr:MAG: UDP-glucose 4-epimerase-like protein [Acidimicrobiales bacterium]
MIRTEPAEAGLVVVVTGGAGFIGSNLCRVLESESSISRVLVVDDFSTGRRENLDGLAVEVVEGSILDEDLLDEAFRGVDAVVHLAARPSVPRSIADPVLTHRVNTDGTVSVLEAARRNGVPHVVVASSSSVYGANETLPKREDMATFPVSPYAASKLAAESYALAWQRSFGLGVLALRFFNVYGPYQPADHAYAAVIPAFVSAALQKRPLRIFGDGLQSRDFTFVGSVTEILRRAVVERVSCPEPVNLAAGDRTDLLTLVRMIEEATGESCEVVHEDPRPGDVRHSMADTARLSSLFPGFRCEPLRIGLERTVDWFRAHLAGERGSQTDSGSHRAAGAVGHVAVHRAAE